jgi:hypothetical protein
MNDPEIVTAIPEDDCRKFADQFGQELFMRGWYYGLTVGSVVGLLVGNIITVAFIRWLHS